MKVLLFKGESIISRLIQWQSRSPFSHAALLFSDGYLVESREFVGVQGFYQSYRDMRGYGECSAFSIKADRINEPAALEWSVSQLRKRYDYRSVARFITRRQEERNGNGRWFCSEFVFAACQKAGVNLLERIEPWACSPGLLALSPLLTLENVSHDLAP
jgi:uncharacterized protein YycO